MGYRFRFSRFLVRRGVISGFVFIVFVVFFVVFFVVVVWGFSFFIIVFIVY